MKLNWDKWVYYNADMFMRHIGTAGAVWCGLSLKHGQVNWGDMWTSLLTGAIVPTIFTICSKGLPERIEETTTLTTKTTLTKTLTDTTREQ